tara:strand:- start:1285 stop:2151 length:867 start_codon:yes stop_codon:yes gene_type:complete
MENNSHEHLNDVVSNQDSSESAVEEVEQSLEAAHEPEKNDDFSRKFAALSRKEKEVRSREAEYEQRIAELEQRFAAKEPQKEIEIPFDVQLRQNPLKALESVGLSYDKLTELALNDGKLTPDMQMKLMREELETDYKSKFEDLESRLVEKEKGLEEQRYEDIKLGFQNEIESFVNSNGEDFELVQANDAKDVVYDVIEEHYNETGKILDIKEAAQAVENYLEEEAEKLLQLSKIRSKFNTGNNEQEPQRQSQVTLSNAHSAQANERVARKLSEEESKSAMAKMLQWDE